MICGSSSRIHKTTFRNEFFQIFFINATRHSADLSDLKIIVIKLKCLFSCLLSHAMHKKGGGERKEKKMFTTKIS